MSNIFSSLKQTWYRFKWSRIDDAINKIEKTIKPDRSKFSAILIDDDRKNKICKSLNKQGFQIEYLKDLSSIDEVSAYDIIICDINGVGKSFGSELEGGKIIELVAEKYPLKYLLAFSGARLGLKMQRVFALCDNCVQKSANETDDLSMALNRAITELSSPYYTWKKVEKALRNKNVNEQEILNYKIDFMSSIRPSSSNIFFSNNMKNNIKSQPINSILSAANNSISIIKSLTT